MQPCTAVGDGSNTPPLFFFFKLLSSQTCFTPLESENWRHGSVKNWTTVPLSPWGTSRMLAGQGLPVKSMFCLWRLHGREYTNATCYRPAHRLSPVHISSSNLWGLDEARCHGQTYTFYFSGCIWKQLAMQFSFGSTLFFFVCFLLPVI